MLSPTGLSSASDILNVSSSIYPDMANSKEINSFKFLVRNRDTEYKMISTWFLECIKKKYSIGQRWPM